MRGLQSAASPVALAGIAVGITQLAGVASAASGALGILPAAVGSAAAAFGTLKLATLGFGEALENIKDPEKFAEALRSLAPQAQQAALAIQQTLMPAFTELQRATQDALFAGVGPQLTAMVNQLLPTVQQTTTGIATAFNQMFMGITNQLMTPETMGAIQTFASNTVQAFQGLAPAVAPFTRALADIAAVGSGFLPELARGAAAAAQSFAQFIAEARQSGQLQQWMQTGLDMVRQMMSVLDDLVKMFAALAPQGKMAMDEIQVSVESVSQAVRILVGDFSALGDSIPTIGQGILNIFNRINSVINLTLKGMNFLIESFNKLPGPDIPAIPEIPRFEMAEGPGAPPPGAWWGPGGPRDTRAGWNPTAGGWGSGGGSSGTWATPGTGGWVTGAVPGTNERPVMPGWGGNIKWEDYAYKPPAGSGTEPHPQFDPSIWQVSPDMSQVAPGADLTGVFSAAEQLSEANLRVLELKSQENVQQSTLIAAENNVVQAQRKLGEAQRDTWTQMEKTAKEFSSGIGEVGAALDQDFGISKGLPGIAENLVKFLANLAAAPMLGQLDAMRQMSEAQTGIQGGYGLMGMMGAQNLAAGKSPLGLPLPPGSATPSAMGPAALQPGGFSDAALLANVPAGRYAQVQAADLTQGLGDCSSAVEDLVNLMDNRPTTGRSMSTANADEWLTSRGFLPGTMPGAFNVGFNSGHMQATLPGGTPFNWGSQEAAARGGIGGSGAFDPAFTSHYYRPVGASTGPLPMPTPVTSGDAPMAVAQQPAAVGSGLPIPLPVTIVGMGGAGFGGLGGFGLPGTPPPGTPASGQGLGPAPGPGPMGGGGQGWGGPTPVPGPTLGVGVPHMSGGMMPGMGMPRAAPFGGGPGVGPTQIGGIAPPSGTGGGGIGLTPGGTIDTAMNLAATAVPGLGQAAATGGKLASRAIQYAGQVAGIGMQGLMETFLPTGGSELANRNWATRLIGGLAGAAPALPNVAGKSAAAVSKDGQPGQQQGAAKGGDTNIHVTEDPNRGADGTGRDIAFHQQNMYAPAGMP